MIFWKSKRKKRIEAEIEVIEEKRQKLESITEETIKTNARFTQLLQQNGFHARLSAAVYGEDKNRRVT